MNTMKSIAGYATVVMALLLMPFSVVADDGSGTGNGNAPSAVIQGFGFPGHGAQFTKTFCAVDTYGALWNLTAANGVITGTRNYVTAGCLWGVSGTSIGKNFRMDLVLQSGTACCEIGSLENGVANVAGRSATGDVYWGGASCAPSGPWPYLLTVPCP